MVYTIQSDICSINHIIEECYETKLDILQYEHDMLNDSIQYEYACALNEAGMEFNFQKIVESVITLFEKVIMFLEQRFVSFKMAYLQIITKADLTEEKLRKIISSRKINHENGVSSSSNKVSGRYLSFDAMYEINLIVGKFNNYIDAYYENKLLNGIAYEIDHIGKSNKEELNPTHEMILVRHDVDHILSLDVDNNLNDMLEKYFITEKRLDISPTDAELVTVLRCFIKKDAEMMIKEIKKSFKERKQRLRNLRKSCKETITLYNTKENRKKDKEFGPRVKSLLSLLQLFSTFAMRMTTSIQNAICNTIIKGLKETKKLFNDIVKINKPAEHYGDEYINRYL